MNRSNIFIKSLRSMCTKPTTNGEITPFVHNRNPRNLERLRLARKPKGYVFEDKLVEYWHKVCIYKGYNYVEAKVIYNTEKVVIVASTQEWAIRQFLYSACDTQAYIILAQVLAQRCFESGINCVTSDVLYTAGSKNEIFLKELLRQGLALEEPPVFDIEDKWRHVREKRPWTVLE